MIDHLVMNDGYDDQTFVLNELEHFFLRINSRLYLPEVIMYRTSDDCVN